jgi:N-acetylglucosaminyldiphosphoundecaprenol N-acetyl-beta-D-mannosaminyltransferase
MTVHEAILGYSICADGGEAVVDQMLAAVRSDGEKVWLACINPHSYVVALEDVEFSRALRKATWLVPDGIGIVYASRALGGGIAERVTGSDVFLGLLHRMNEVGEMSVFFLGSTDETLSAIRARMACDFPNVRVAGTYSPPFRPVYDEQELKAMIAAVNDAKPDVLWVGMTAPKQEKWIFQNLGLLDVRLACAIGAVFDFYTGKVKRSHPVFQRLGLEWLPRLIQEPRRLWRRMFVSAPIFVLHVLRCRVSRRHGS